VTIPEIEQASLGLHSFDEYEPLIGIEAAERVRQKAERLQGLHVVHVSSTFYGGGVSEMLTPLTLLMNAMGIETGWRLIQGTPEFFSCTKKIHNLLQGATVELTAEEREIYERVALANAMRLHLEDHDAVIVHDPQPLTVLQHQQKAAPWIWQCHVDLSAPNPATWEYLRRFIELYDTAIFSLPEYAQDLATPQHFMMPAIDPLSPKNRGLSEAEIAACLAHYNIPTDRPLVAQISRFDRWKDPAGVIQAFRIARRQVDSTLVLLGNVATDDPESQVMLETINRSVDERVMVISVEDPVLVNALQRRAAVVLQKSIREGFGLTVTEAMWKGAAVIGGAVGGIRRQIVDGENGFLVGSVEQAAERIVQLLKDERLRARLGAKAKETVRRNFLMSRLAEDWIDFLGSLPARSH
jgi:trehalose synthase